MYPDDLMVEVQRLRNLVSRLNEASVRINESLDFDTVLQGVLDSARSLTDARYGVIILLDDAGHAETLLASGLTPEEAHSLWNVPNAMWFLEHLGRIPEPLRVSDLLGHLRAQGLAEPGLPVPVSAFLAAPVRRQGRTVATIYLARDESGREFDGRDEDTLVMFASQAALVISNARIYRDEHRARTDLETLIDTSPVGVVVFDARTGRLLLSNREVERIVDSLRDPDGSPEQLLEVMTFVRADGREVSLEEFSMVEALSLGETVRAEEIVMRVPDGRSVTALVNATPIYSADGEIESLIVTLQDMTPMEELERQRAEFLGMVSHELRVPLTSIRGSAATLLDEGPALDPAELRQFYRIIVEQADDMRRLIGDLLDVARIETGALSVSPEPSDMAVLVDEARNTFLTAGGRNNLEINLTPDLPRVMADRRRIVQVLGNLLSNAARNSPESSVIGIEAVLDDRHVSVSVTDDGRGISADRLPHLFRKHTPRDGTDRGRGISRSGLGLVICKGIVEAHGGRIWGASDGPGLGARFTFTIPMVEEPAAETESFSGLARRAAQQRTRVLAVDDDPQALRNIRDALAMADYVPIVTADPRDVERLMEKERPDLVLLDLMLPGTDGMELMRSILEMADVPVIFLSAYGQEQNVSKALDMGADDYIVKPFAPSELAARIRAALRRRSGLGRFSQPAPFILKDLSIEYGERRAALAGREVELTATEYAVLVDLSMNAGLVLTHDQLLRRVWGLGNSGDSGLVRTIVNRLRRKLGDDANDPGYIFTVPRVGYRMPKPEEGVK